MKVHTDFGTNVFLTAAYMSRDESKARISEACTQFVKQCGHDSMVIAHRPGAAFGFVKIEHPNQSVEHPRSPSGVRNRMITTAEKGGNEVQERSEYAVIGFVKSGEVGGVREVPDHPVAEDTHGASKVSAGRGSYPAVRTCNH